MNFVTSYWPWILLAVALVALAFVKRAKIGAAVSGVAAKVAGTKGSTLIHGELATFEQDWTGMAAALAPHLKSMETNIVGAVHTALGKAPAAHAPAAQAAPPAAVSASTSSPASTSTADSGGTAPIVAAVVVTQSDQVLAAHAVIDTAIATHQGAIVAHQAAITGLQGQKDALSAAQAAVATAVAAVAPAAATAP
jgi:hypothetical protein